MNQQNLLQASFQSLLINKNLNIKHRFACIQVQATLNVNLKKKCLNAFKILIQTSKKNQTVFDQQNLKSEEEIENTRIEFFQKLMMVACKFIEKRCFDHFKLYVQKTKNNKRQLSIIKKRKQIIAKKMYFEQLIKNIQINTLQKINRPQGFELLNKIVKKKQKQKGLAKIKAFIFQKERIFTILESFYNLAQILRRHSKLNILIGFRQIMHNQKQYSSQGFQDDITQKIIKENQISDQDLVQIKNEVFSQNLNQSNQNQKYLSDDMKIEQKQNIIQKCQNNQIPHNNLDINFILEQENKQKNNTFDKTYKKAQDTQHVSSFNIDQNNENKLLFVNQTGVFYKNNDLDNTEQNVMINSFYQQTKNNNDQQKYSFYPFLINQSEQKKLNEEHQDNIQCNIIQDQFDNQKQNEQSELIPKVKLNFKSNSNEQVINQSQNDNLKICQYDKSQKLQPKQNQFFHENNKICQQNLHHRSSEKKRQLDSTQSNEQIQENHQKAQQNQIEQNQNILNKRSISQQQQIEELHDNIHIQNNQSNNQQIKQQNKQTDNILSKNKLINQFIDKNEISNQYEIKNEISNQYEIIDKNKIINQFIDKNEISNQYDILDKNKIINQLIDKNEKLNQYEIIDKNKLMNQQIDKKEIINQYEIIDKNEIINQNEIINKMEILNQYDIIDKNDIINLHKTKDKNELIKNDNDILFKNDIISKNHFTNKNIIINEKINKNEMLNNYEIEYQNELIDNYIINKNQIKSQIETINQNMDLQNYNQNQNIKNYNRCNFENNVNSYNRYDQQKINDLISQQNELLDNKNETKITMNQNEQFNQQISKNIQKVTQNQKMSNLINDSQNNSKNVKNPKNKQIIESKINEQSESFKNQNLVKQPNNDYNLLGNNNNVVKQNVNQIQQQYFKSNNIEQNIQLNEKQFQKLNMLTQVLENKIQKYNNMKQQLMNHSNNVQEYQKNEMKEYKLQIRQLLSEIQDLKNNMS